MKKTTFLVFLLSCFYNGYPQTLSYSIEYGVDFYRLPNVVKEKPEYIMKGRLVLNDTFSFYYQSKYQLNFSKNQILAKKVFHHSYHRKPSQHFKASGASFRIKKPVWILDSREIKWTPHHERKTILGYSCLSAISIDSTQNIVLVYYTTELPPHFGPESYGGLPGTILEVFNSRYSRHIVATKITKGTFTLVLPKKTAVLTNSEYQNIRPPAVEPTVTFRKF